MPSPTKIIQSIRLLLLIGITANGVKSECLQCMYDGTDKDDCRDYGLVNGEFVPWYLGSQECLGHYGIKIAKPNAEIICASSSSFVNDVRFGFLSTKDARLGLGTNEGGFFEQDPNQNNKVVLNDSITISGKTYDCSSSESSCYNAMKPYFESDPDGKKEMEDICDQLYNEVMNSAQLEQSILRNRLCMEFNEGESIPSSCEPLWDQLEEMINANSSGSCQSFSMGIGTKTPPGCDDLPVGDKKPTSAAPTILLSKYLSTVSTIFTFTGFVLTLLYL
uniref:Uncharacterized protein n=1 Tax=Helicotheca tamesis TaxID=374047 RepID=A0A7S2IIF6_9STRA|eukprot:CAMPEP_0185731136 /NCGR_PEP_ID=MMETSP1171-20130828/11972_1 /TAXON_ID=374046 /ORGANISM="Helicotheca tamensis, Strain CCMP826" /LENGTH=276 /DNA_ID=CAMNT_0028400333 /DNA_START=30 /DNA_END=860 /DNA_ORIENTATION=+